MPKLRIFRLTIILTGFLCYWLYACLASAQANLLLEEDDLLFFGEEHIVITATKANIRLSEAPATVSVITSEDIQRYGWRTLADVLRSQAGYQVFSDRIYNFVVPRGYYLSNDPNSRILLMINSHSVVEFFGYYNGHLAAIDLNHVKQIEIVRGPNSALYGTNAMFSVINIITKKGRDLDGFKLINEIGSFEHTKWSFSYGREFNHGLDVFFQGNLLATGNQTLYFDEYDHPDYPSAGYTTGQANREELSNASFSIAYRNFSLQGMHNDRKKHVPTGLYGGQFNQDRTFFQDINQYLELKYHLSIDSKVESDFRIHTDRYEYRGRFMYYPDPNWISGPSYESEYNTIENRSFGGEWQISLNLNERSKTIFGGEYKNYEQLDFAYYSENDPDHNLNERYCVDPEENIVSAFLLHTIYFKDQFILEAGLHYDDYSSIGNHLSPKGSISYQPFSKTWLKLLYGEAFRAPNFWERNEEGTIFWVLGNPDLKPEMIRNVEFIFSTTLNRRLGCRSSMYYYQMDDNIQQVDGKWQNVEGLTGLGLEAELVFTQNENMGYMNFSYSDVTSEVDDQRIGFSAQWLAKAGITRKFANRLTVSCETQFVGPRLKGLRSEPELEAYNLTNLTLSGIKVADRLTVSLSISNIFDVDYQHPSFVPDLATWNMNAAHPVYDIPADGRSFLLKSVLTF